MTLIVDLFAGGGGASEGIRLALGRDPDIAVNHDEDAVAVHLRNHPGTHHHCASVWNVEPVAATGGRPVADAAEHREGRPHHEMGQPVRRTPPWLYR